MTPSLDMFMSSSFVDSSAALLARPPPQDGWSHCKCIDLSAECSLEIPRVLHGVLLQAAATVLQMSTTCRQGLSAGGRRPTDLLRHAIEKGLRAVHQRSVRSVLGGRGGCRGERQSLQAFFQGQHLSLPGRCAPSPRVELQNSYSPMYICCRNAQAWASRAALLQWCCILRPWFTA